MASDAMQWHIIDAASRQPKYDMMRCEAEYVGWGLQKLLKADTPA
jgi:hypothetical protein